jgi:hypothetical protein
VVKNLDLFRQNLSGLNWASVRDTDDVGGGDDADEVTDPMEPDDPGTGADGPDDGGPAA